MLTRFELEHCAHAARENGYLVVTYDQFVEFGILRRFIRPTIDELRAVGLLVIEHQGRYGAGRYKTDASMYRLTYLRSKFVPAVGQAYYLEPTNEWRRYVKPPKPKTAAENRVSQFPRRNCFSSPLGTETNGLDPSPKS
jgi:hypothetical protein